MNHAVLSRIVAVAVFALAAPAFADPAPGELYDGETIAQAPARAAAWGGGSAVDSTDSVFAVGKQSVLASINGPYQGIVFTLASPIALGDPRADQTRYLSITLSPVVASPPAPPPPPKAHRDGPPDRIGSIRTGSLMHLAQFAGVDGQAPGGQPGQPGAPNQPGGVAAPVAPPPPPPIKNLRFVLGLTDGSSVEYVRSIPDPPLGTTWVTMGVPLAGLAWSADQAKNAQLSSIVIGGDTAGTLYIASLKIASDTSPIAVNVSGDTEFAVSQPGNYSAVIDAGSSNVTWTWNANDGSPVEHGQTFTHMFPRPGKYNVELTVADIDGLKKPITGSFKVVVQAD